MGAIGAFSREMLIIGVLASSRKWQERLEPLLISEFGPVAARSRVFPFRWTSYYDREMGDSIVRGFYAFERLVDPQELWRIKTHTNTIETQYCRDGQRRINLDPGLLSLGRLILATTKDTAHRIPLQNGIYGEVTLLYQKGRFKPLEWTYPDYASEEYNRFFKELRSLYKQLRRT